MLRSLACIFLLAGAHTSAQERHVHTDRPTPRLLPLPKGDDCFFFAVYGDRTGGKPEGLKVLDQAVHDTNLLDPDLVMTVGDLVEGYNQPKEWLAEMHEFKAIMNKLRMAWFPVAGNHDTYSRNDKRQLIGGNAKHYEKHFGPLWYWFAHKNCAFVVLYSDEGDPQTGRVGFKKPVHQKMSPAQFRWLEKTLAENRKRDHVFVFLHHPRWHGGQYGDDWDKVHKALVANGNVRAVFAGHIHKMVYAGKKDGIEYFTLATTGGALSTAFPERAGYLHHFNIVTVRKDGIRVSTIPVGAVIDPKLVTAAVSAEVRRLNDQLAPRGEGPLPIGAGGEVGGFYTVRMKNPTSRPIEVTLVPECSDPRWGFRPDHQHATIPAGATRRFRVIVSHPKSGIDDWFAVPVLRVRGEYLAPGLRIAMRERTSPFWTTAPPTGKRATANGYLTLVRGACLKLPAGKAGVRGDQLTVECFVRGRKFTGRRLLVSDKSFALSLLDGNPEFRVTTDKGRKQIKASVGLEPGSWHHVAAVLGGGEARLYLDGRLVARGAAPGGLKNDDKSRLLVGAGMDRRGRLVNFAELQIDEVRVLTSARYDGAGFAVTDRRKGFANDANTALLLHLDQNLGPWIADFSAHQAQPRRVGQANCVRERIR